MELTPFTRFLLWMLNQRHDVTINLTDSSLAPDEIDPDHDPFDQPLDDHAHAIAHLNHCLSLDPSRHHHP